MPVEISAERWKTIEPLLDAALDLEPEMQSAFFNEHCANDPTLRSELESLIAACERGTSLPESPATDRFAEFVRAEFVEMPSAVGLYEVIRQLGRGGMATVYLANDQKHGRQVAVKVLHRSVAELVGADRFAREIEIAARLSHPHILPLHDSGVMSDAESDKSIPYYVTPYVAGESLRDRLRRDKSIPLEETIRLIREIADALSYAHRQGVVHCDIKPENILLHEGHAIVADFGIARAISSTVTRDSVARLSLMFGTPAYMSPEQSEGNVTLDGRTDIYALGCLLREMAGPAGQSSNQFNAVITRATEHDRERRFSTVDEFTSALIARRTSPFRRVALSVGVVAAAMLVAALVWRPTPKPLDGNLVAVAPFTVVDTSLLLWREGLVDVLARNLDGAGSLKSVPPSLIMRGWSGRADVPTARALGERTQAGLVLYGAILSAGDSVRATAAILDTRTGHVIVVVERRDIAERMDRVADSLTVSVVRELSRTRRVDAIRTNFSATSSLPALKEYLQGEQFYRRAAWDSAEHHFEQAIHFDTTFAIAYHRLAGVREWRDPEEFGNPATTALLERAAQFRGKVGPRDSLLLHIDSLRAAAEGALRERVRTRHSRAHEETVRQLLGALSKGVRDNPKDAELALLHANARGDNEQWISAGEVDEPSILASFDTAIALDSSFAPAYLRPIAMAAQIQGAQGVRRYLRGYLATNPNGKRAALMRATDALLDSTMASDKFVAAMLDTLPRALKCEAGALLYRVDDQQDLAVRLFHGVLPAGVGGASAGPPECSPVVAAFAFMFRGRLREASELVGPEYHWMKVAMASNLTRFGMKSVDSSRASFDWLFSLAPRTMSPDAYRWWVLQRDTAHILAYVRHYEAAAADSANGATNAQMHRANAITGKAFYALALGDTARAINILQSIKPSQQLCWYYGREMLARLLLAANRDREAATLLEQRWAGSTSCGTPVDDVLWTLYRARAFERVNRRADALANYQFVARVWKHADRELQPLVTEAVAGAARMSKQ